MKFDFESIIDRRGIDSMAVDIPCNRGPQGYTKEGFDRIPMWIADMNYATAPTVQEQMIERIKHPCFGYYEPREEYYDAIIKWQKTHNGIQDLEVENIGYENGVLGGVVSALNVLCQKGDHVLVHSPTYCGFIWTLDNNGYHLVDSPLVQDENDTWRMDFKDMEEKIVKYKIHTCIFCSPHNPCGRVWTYEELEEMYRLFEKHQVYVIADEIWSDLILKGNKHIQAQTVNEYAKYHTVTFYSLSKTFSLAGLVASYHICYDKRLDDRLKKQASLCHYNEMNVLSMHALIGAYKDDGYLWLEELLEVLTDRIDYGYQFIKEHFEGVKLSKPEGTYMLYIDCEEWCKKHNKTIDEVQQKGIEYGVMWQDGRDFFGDWCMRINVALPKVCVVEAFDRLDQYVFNADW